MGFLDLFRRRRATTELEQRVVAEWGSSAIPGPTEGAPGTYASTLAELRTAESSLQAVAVWSACDLIASVASQLPLDTYQRVSGAQPKQIPNGKLVQDPGGEGYGAQDWIYQYLMSKLLRGNSFGRQLSPDPSTGYPTQIVLYHPDCVQGWRDRIDGMVRWHVEGRQVPASQMWHRRSYPMPGTLLGMSPVGQHAVTIGQGMAAARFGLQFFTDGGVPGGILRNTETTVDQTLAAKVKAKWMAVMHGSREPAVLGKGWEWQGVSVNPEESQFLETQKYTSAQCARIFGPNVAEILGYETGGSMTYNTMVDRDMSFLKYTLNRWLVDLETTVFTPNLPKPQFVKFNRAALLSMDLLSRYRSYQLGISSKFLTPDEAREHEDLAPLSETQKRELIELDVKPPSPGGTDSNPSTARGEPDGVEERTFNPAAHPHDPHNGEFIGTPGGAASSAVKDALELAGRIDLDEREKLISSGRLVGDNGGDMHMNWAVIHSPAGNEARIGIIPHHDSDRWRAAEKGGTAVLDSDQVRKLRSDLANAGTEAKKAAKEADALGDAALPSNPSPRQKVLFGMEPVAAGVLPTDWADLHWVAFLTDDESAPWQVSIYPGDPDELEGAHFEPKTFGKLLKLLDGIDSELAESAARAAGQSERRTARHNQLKEYWTKGEGLAKWADHPHPWTALYRHLVKHMAPARAKRVASQWFHDVFGIWPGEREGDNPVGPG